MFLLQGFVLKWIQIEALQNYFLGLQGLHSYIFMFKFTVCNTTNTPYHEKYSLHYY